MALLAVVVPERWLVEPGHALYPPNGGWRPFEFGPRNCIGQNMSLINIKVTLAMTVREFESSDQYAEYDRLHPSSGIKTVFGERAYQIPQGAAHPVHGFPCKVTSQSQNGLEATGAFADWIQLVTLNADVIFAKDGSPRMLETPSNRKEELINECNDPVQM